MNRIKGYLILLALLFLSMGTIAQEKIVNPEISYAGMPKTYILVPGYGAQGGTAKDLAPYFNEDGLGAIVNSSRGIIAAYKNDAYAKFGEQNFADASRQAVVDMITDINSIF